MMLKLDYCFTHIQLLLLSFITDPNKGVMDSNDLAPSVLSVNGYGSIISELLS